MYKKFILLLIIILFNFSCSINGTFHGLYSYYNKTTSEAPSLIVKPKVTELVCEIKKSKTPKVFLIQGSSLKKCINNYESAIIYMWKPKCKGEYCYELGLLQDICTAKRIELFVVSQYFDTKSMLIKYNIDRPVFGVDTEHYKTNLTEKYLSRFIYDLTSKNYKGNNFLYFKKGSLIKSFDDIELI